MKHIIQNLYFTIRNFKVATLLNILGLSVAFTVFMIIMIQVDYDRTFDKSYTDFEKIYRIDSEYDNTTKAILSRPVSNIIFQQGQVESGCLIRNFASLVYLKAEGSKQSTYFKESVFGASPSFTEVFDLEMIEGNPKALDQPQTIIIAQSLAKKIFGEGNVLGKQLVTLSNSTLTVGGVYKDLPDNSTITNSIYTGLGDENINNWGNWNYSVYAKLKTKDNGTLNEIVKNELVKLQQVNRNDFNKFNLVLTPISDLHFLTGVVYDKTPKIGEQTVYMLFTIGILIILIAAINFTNFSMALSPRRLRSINTHKVLGANNLSLRIALIFESVLISCIAFILSLVIVHTFSLSSLSNLISVDINIQSQQLLIGITLLIATVTGIFSGLYPAIYITSFQPAMVLKGSFGLSPKGRQMRNILIGVQFVASLSLIICASLMYIQNKYMLQTPLGYDKDQLILAEINTNIYKNNRVFSQQLKSFSGIEAVTYSETILSTGDQYMNWGRKYKDEEITYYCLPVDPSFLSVLGIELTEGRDFSEDDQLSRNGKYIFNNSAKNLYNLELGTSIDSSEIIGFMPDIHFTTFRTESGPMAFYIWGKNNWGSIPQVSYIRVKSGTDILAALEHVKQTLKNIDSEIPLNVSLVEDILSQTYEKDQNLGLLISIFSLIAIAISIVGVFGLVVFESEYRSKEVSIRKVLGASTSQVLISFNIRYLTILLICFIISCPISYYIIAKWLENFSNKTPIHWWVFILSSIPVFLITIGTVTWQSWKIASSNPVNALKSE